MIITAKTTNMEKALEAQINKLLKTYTFDNVKYGFHLISLTDKLKIKKNEKLFIYPASIYKIFIAAEVLRQIDSGALNKNKILEVDRTNAVDEKISKLTDDKRPILLPGDRVNIEYLLDLMCYRSDNSAANILVDVITRESINKNIIKKHDLLGSEVTRKFLPRELEEIKYKNAPISTSCASHISKFFSLIEKGELVNPQVSSTLKWMLRKNSTGRWRSGVDIDSLCFTKGGWYENINSYGQNINWSGDSGIIINRGIKYSFALLSITKSQDKNKVFPIREFAEIIHEYIKKSS